MKQWLWAVSVVAWALFCGGGCSTPTGSTVAATGGTYISPDEQGVMTEGLDDHDYDLVARAVSEEFKKRGLPKGSVVVLGPVDTRETPYDVRVMQLQKSLQAIFNQEGSIRFMVLANSKTGETVEQAIINLKAMNWEIKNPSDAEEADKLGSIAKVSGILYGRVSSMENVLPDKKAKEVRYRFVWELTSTVTGLNEITFEYKLGKRVALGR